MVIKIQGPQYSWLLGSFEAFAPIFVYVGELQIDKCPYGQGLIGTGSY
jgi:hypothetical protein